MRISSSVWFWILQVIGWGIPVSLNLWGKIATDSISNKNYAISETIIILVSGILSTSLLRWYLKKHLNFDQFKGKDILRIFLAMVVTTILFVLSFLIALPLYEYFNGVPMEMSQLLIIANIFNGFGFIFLWLLFYIAIKSSRRIRENRLERLKMETTIKEAQLNTLKGQINPHFMFNSLNNIRGLMLEDVEKSREMITRLSDMLRYSLTKNDVNTIALKHELEMVDNFIALSKIQLEDRLIFSSEIEEGLDNLEIPPMVIQMLIENAVKHGISNQTNGGEVSLKISEEEKNLHITVTNTGTLVQSNNSTKIGLKNIESRLKLQYGNQAQFKLSEKNNLVTASIQLPI